MAPTKSKETDVTKKKPAVKEQIVAAYVAEGHRASAIKKLTIYLKPEERKAYYVINEKATGDVDL